MTLDEALIDAEDRLLIALLVHHTGDTRWLAEPYRTLCAVGPDAAAMSQWLPTPIRPEEVEILRKTLRHKVEELTSDSKLWHRQPLQQDDIMLQLIRTVTAADLAPGYLQKLKADFGFEPIVPRDQHKRPPKIIIVGAGFSGLSIAIKLKQLDIPFQMLERNSNVGGVWQENHYPGCGVDSPSHVYSLSDNQNPTWSRYFVGRDEIMAYTRRTIEAFGLVDTIEFNTTVTAMAWSTETSEWSVHRQASDGSTSVDTCDVVITTAGTLNQPKTPDIENLDQFQGDIFHTARWRNDVQIASRSVGMIGNGSSGFQVGPYLADTAAHLVAFQRSPAWASPNPRVGAPVPETVSWLLNNIPDYALWHRFVMYWTSGDAGYQNLVIDPAWSGPGISASNNNVRDRLTDYIHEQFQARPELIPAMVPAYPPYTKRMVVDNGWYAALTKDTVELVVDEVVRATPDGLVTADGRHHDLDVIVFATGFHGTRFLWPMQVRGRTGHTPAEIAGRNDDIRAYLGISMPEFPNLFSIFGPNSSIGHGGSAIHIAESQAHYIAQCILAMTQQEIRTIECRPQVSAAYNDKLDHDMLSMVWTEPGVRSRYRNTEGRIVSNHPWTLQKFWEMTRQPNLDDYILTSTG